MKSLIYYCFSSDLSLELSSNAAAWGIYCSHLIKFTLVCSHGHPDLSHQTLGFVFVTLHLGCEYKQQ